MKIDEIDLDILLMLGSLDPEDDITTSKLAKEIFELNGDEQELRKKTNFIHSRLQNKLVPNDLVNVEKENGKNVYVLSDNVYTAENTDAVIEGEEVDLTHLVAINEGDRTRINALAPVIDPR